VNRKSRKNLNHLKRQIAGVVTLAVAIFCLASFYVGYPVDGGHAFGPAGHLISLIFGKLVGDGKYLLGFLGVFLGFRLIKDKDAPFIGARNGGSIILFLVLVAFLHIKYVAALGYWEAVLEGWQGFGGGIVGAALAVVFYAVFGAWGSYIVLATLGMIWL